MAYGDKMAIDWALVIALLPIFGGLIGWLIIELRGRTSKKVEFEQRIAKIEQHLAVIDTKEVNFQGSVSGMNEALTEIKLLLKDMDNRTRQNEIDIARLSPR